MIHLSLTFIVTITREPFFALSDCYLVSTLKHVEAQS